MNSETLIRTKTKSMISDPISQESRRFTVFSRLESVNLSQSGTAIGQDNAKQEESVGSLIKQVKSSKNEIKIGQVSLTMLLALPWMIGVHRLLSAQRNRIAVKAVGKFQNLRHRNTANPADLAEAVAMLKK